MTTLIIIASWLAGSILAYILTRWSFRRDGLGWTTFDRRLGLFVSLTTWPLLLIALISIIIGKAIGLGKVFADDDKPASW